MNKLILPVVAAVIVNFGMLAHAADQSHARALTIAQAQQAAQQQIAQAR